MILFKVQLCVVTLVMPRRFNTLNVVQTLLSNADEAVFKQKAVAIKNPRREHHFYSLTSQGNLSTC